MANKIPCTAASILDRIGFKYVCTNRPCTFGVYVAWSCMDILALLKDSLPQCTRCSLYTVPGISNRAVHVYYRPTITYPYHYIHARQSILMPHSSVGSNNTNILLQTYLKVIQQHIQSLLGSAAELERLVHKTERKGLLMSHLHKHTHTRARPTEGDLHLMEKLYESTAKRL